MLFNSYEFMLAFLPVFMIGYFLIRHIYREKKELMRLCNLWIIAASLVFYSLFGMQNFLVLVVSILWNATLVRFFASKKIRSKEICKWWLAFGIAVDVALLLLYKFRGTALPIAISFYTFNQISFLVDFYRGEIKEFDALSYLSYILFFPKLLQGPLISYEDYSKELDVCAKMTLDWEKVMRGLLLISIGLFKKVIMADTIGKAVDYGYSNLANLGWIEAVLTAVFYSFQLYFDFSGYCDVASGICAVMGFDLNLNFDSPYKAVNIIDFWNRWHITLTKFFTKYIYIPLGGSRKGTVRTYVNILIVFLISGLWHGTGWTFIVWGAMHGVLNVLTRAVSKFDKASDKSENAEKDCRRTGCLAMRIIGVIKRAATFIYVTAAWVFFRASNISDAILLFKRMFSGGIRPYYSDFADFFRLDEIWYVLKLTPIVDYNFSWDLCMWIFLIFSAVIIFFCKSGIRYAKETKLGVFTTILTAFLLVWCVLSFGGVSTFLYMNF